MPGVIQIVRVSPVSTVDENDRGMRARMRGKAQIAELQRVGAIGNARVGFWRWQGQDVLAQGGIGGSGSQESSSSHEQHYCTGEGTQGTRGTHGTLGTPVPLVFRSPQLSMSENRWCYSHPCFILKTWTQMFVIAPHRRAMPGLTACSLSPCARRGFFAVRFVPLARLSGGT